MCISDRDEAALDLERVLRRYLTLWKKSRIVLMGYSFGADALPAMVNRSLIHI